jgi:DNA repair photolyase
MHIGERRGDFIRRYDEDESNSIVCFPFWQLAVAMGCPYRCSYCFLQTVIFFRPTKNKKNLMGLVYRNVSDMVAELRDWLEDPVPKQIIAGELQDGLVFDSAYQRVTGAPLTHWLHPLFAGQRRPVLIYLTKSSLIEHAMKLPPTRQIVHSWSVNAEAAAAMSEFGCPTPAERFAAAQRMKEAGWRIRFRLDPMIPYDGWQGGYAEAIDRINAIGPEMVTLGALRATNTKGLRRAAIENGRDPAVFDYLSTRKDPSNFKYRTGWQAEMFRFALDRLRVPGTTGLCKEDREVWRALGKPFTGCHCLLGASDPLAAHEPLRITRTPMRLP